jgi:hypothetical protein
MKATFICILNEKGKIVKEINLSSSPEAIGNFLQGTDFQIEKLI